MGRREGDEGGEGGGRKELKRERQELKRVRERDRELNVFLIRVFL
jgi:hypothetical protein